MATATAPAVTSRSNLSPTVPSPESLAILGTLIRLREVPREGQAPPSFNGIFGLKLTFG